MEENSSNEDAFATRQYEPGTAVYCNTSGNTVMNSGNQERFSLLCSEGAIADSTEIRESAEEVQLKRKLRIQRLQHQICEEDLEHLLKVKNLIRMLQPTTLEATEDVSSLTTCNRDSVNENSLEQEISIVNRAPNLFSPAEVELTKKLQLQRIRHQIELEEAKHKLKMKQLNDTQT